MRKFALNIQFKVLIGHASRAGRPMVTLILGPECESSSCTEEDQQEVVCVWGIWCLWPWEWMRQEVSEREPSGCQYSRSAKQRLLRRSSIKPIGHQS